MKLLTSPSELGGTLIKLMGQYRYFDWAVAWASVGFPAFRRFERYEEKARRIVVGTHFYQTHPDFIGRFLESRAFRFILQPDGVFHPKIYFFENSQSDWACVLGSPNFTGPALSTNTEAAVVFDSTEPNADELRHQAALMIDRAWKEADQVLPDELTAYRNLWNRYRPVQERMAGKFGGKRSTKSTASAALFRYDWDKYLRLLRADPHHDFERRLEVLRLARGYFERNIPFSGFSEKERREVAGYAPDGEVMWRYFGSMQGAGVFKGSVRKNAPEISMALDAIPLHGPVSEKHYDRFVFDFLKAFPKGGVKVSTATRLLAMKRPDVFVCISDRNAKHLGDDFGIASTRLQHRFDAYWPEVIERIQETAWWRSEEPEDPNEKEAWFGRSALIDAIYYEPLK